jgi:hypothetical protein
MELLEDEFPLLPTYTNPSENKPSPGPPIEQSAMVKKPADPNVYLNPNEHLDFESLFDQSNSIESCTICLEFLDQKLSALECGHVYHSKCIHDCFKSTKVIFFPKIYTRVVINAPVVTRMSAKK